MSAGTSGGIDETALQALIAASGMRLTPAETDAVAQSLARAHAAAAMLLRAPAFDETIERFYRLLEGDADAGAGR